jgi:hypothetical protein
MIRILTSTFIKKYDLSVVRGAWCVVRGAWCVVRDINVCSIWILVNINLTQRFTLNALRITLYENNTKAIYLKKERL